LTLVHGSEASINVNGLQFFLAKNKEIVYDIIEKTTDVMEITLEEFTS
jgi:hypothetical protein